MDFAGSQHTQFFTIGHSTRTLEEFVQILHGFGIQRVVDVRTVPRSRRNPQYNRETLPGSLHTAGIEYTHMADLGGFRQAQPDSLNTGWRNDSFRGYADYMQTDGFEQALQNLVEIGNLERVAILCAEAVPWRCHRSLIADALTIRGFPVVEILDKDHSQAHRLTSFAKVEGTRLTYPPET